jgi:hypothetical protein
MAASVHCRNDSAKPHKPRSPRRQYVEILKVIQHRNGFPRLDLFAQWLCHENYGDKQREQAILLDIAARNLSKTSQPVSRVVRKTIDEMTYNPKRRVKIMDEMASTKCHNDRMTKKRTRRANYKTTEWNLGQPLAFPPRLNPSTFERLARKAVEEAVNDPFKRKGTKRTRKK